MLAQEDLGEMGLSSPSEQVAYLLVERATLLERLEAAEGKLESQSYAGSLKECDHQVNKQKQKNKINFISSNKTGYTSQHVLEKVMKILYNSSVY